jgi:hypothetical protein
MLQQSKPTSKIQEWYDKLEPVVEEARETLKGIKPSKLILRSGCEQDQDGNYRLTFLWQEYVISNDDFVVHWADSDKEVPSFFQSLILTYLATANGTTPSGRWVSYRELPDGMFYAQAFQGYSGNRLLRELEGGIEAFRRAAETLGGEPLELGDAGYVFTILPRIHLVVVYWEGDEEFPLQFPSQAQVLFEDTATNYMSTDGLAILGSQLVGKILKTAKAT